MRAGLAAGELLVGPAVMSASPAVVETIAAAGFDWAMLDAEHGATGIDVDLEHMIRAADAAGMPALVRVPEPDASGIAKALDMGAAGVVVPRVTTVAQVEACVAAAKYAPLGSRGMCPGIRVARRGADWIDYHARANVDTLLVIMIERRLALDVVEEIAAVPGVDGLCFGPGDYALDAGLPPEAYLPDGSDEPHPELVAAALRVIGACAANGLVGVNFAWDAQRIDDWARIGYRCILFNTDVGLLADSLGAVQSEIAAAVRRLSLSAS